MVMSLCLLSGGFATPPLTAADWVDTQGESFVGEPAGLLGPLALFKSGRARGKRLPLPFLKPDDAWRYEQGLRELPARAEVWADGDSRITRELRGIVERLEGNKIVDTDLRDRSEPELLLVFYAEAGSGVQLLMESAVQHYNRLQPAYGDDFEVVFVGKGRDLLGHKVFAESLHMPWLVTKRNRQSQLDVIALFAPEEGAGFALLNRHGVPITSASNIIGSDVDRIFQELEGLLKAMVPNNPKTWVVKVEYFKNVRLREFATGEAPPLLVGPPLLRAQLDRIGVTAFDLEAEVDAQGKATRVTVQPGPGIPEKYVAAVEKSVATVPFVPAVSNGKFVAGTLHYRYRAEQP